MFLSGSGYCHFRSSTFNIQVIEIVNSETNMRTLLTWAQTVSHFLVTAAGFLQSRRAGESRRSVVSGKRARASVRIRPQNASSLLAASLMPMSVFLFATSSFSAPPIDSVCWEFDGSLKDSAGAHSDTAQSVGRVRFLSAAELPGTIGKAAAFGLIPGDAAYLHAAASTDFQLPSAYTIEAWVLPMWRGNAPEWNRLVLNWGVAPNYAYHRAFHRGRLSLYHAQADGEFAVAEGGQIQAGRWQHVAAVARRNDAEPGNSRLEIYLNGKQVGAAAYDGTIAVLDGEGLGIGDSAGVSSAGARFTGYIDHISIRKHPLSAAEISAMHQVRAGALAKLKPLAPPQPAQVAQVARPVQPLPKELGVEEIVFSERHPGRDVGGHYYANFGYNCTDGNYWMHGADGTRLCRLRVATGEVKVILEDHGGAVRDPQVHYDAKKILFSYRKGGTHHYDLYEINIDGSGLRQITYGPWDDVEPTYLPDGAIIFCSSRAKRYIPCWQAPTALLYRCDADGTDMRMLSSGSATENTPAVLPDGRVIYTRWEYVNRDAVVFHHLWMTNPDGTGQKIYYGNMNPGGVFIDAKPIPGTDKVLFINSPGHGQNEHMGSVAVVSNSQGPDSRSALRAITKQGYRDPYPLSEDTFLAASGNKLMLFNSGGKMRVLYQAPMMLHEPQPLRRRDRERVIPSRVDTASDSGTLIMEDVYVGRNMEGIKRGSIKKLLVLEDLPKPANYHGGGSSPLGHGVTSTLKRILGTVPVEEDGSAHFQVPASRSVYFAALDDQDRSVKQMRSFVTLQPGETMSCVGCHEHRVYAPEVGRRNQSLASVRPASKITPIPEVPDVLDFPRDVQPILDRHCVSCHGNDKRDGGVSLAGDHGPVFSHSYYELLLFWQVKDTAGTPGYGSGRQKGNDKPNSTYSSASPLMNKIDGRHHQVKLSAKELLTIRLWIDVSAQYPGTVAAIGTGQIGGMWGNNKPVREMTDAWPSTKQAGEAMQRRCGSCHGKTMPRHVTDRTSLSFGDFLSWERPLSRYSRHRIFNLSNPDKSLALRATLAKAADGLAEGAATKKASDVREPPKPIVHPIVFKDKQDPDYQKILAHLQDAKKRLEEIKRFDMAGFKPRAEYVREMKRYGVIRADFDLSKDKIDVYEVDRKYWSSMWHSPK